jgi:hypothetical protein
VLGTILTCLINQLPVLPEEKQQTCREKKQEHWQTMKNKSDNGFVCRRKELGNTHQNKRHIILKLVGGSKQACESQHPLKNQFHYSVTDHHEKVKIYSEFNKNCCLIHYEKLSGNNRYKDVEFLSLFHIRNKCISCTKVVDSLNHGTDCCYYFAFIKNL